MIITVGEYQLDDSKLLGGGDCGKVYIGRNVRTGKEVALKKIPLKNSSLPITLLREAFLQMEITHPNLLRMEAVIVGDGFIVFALDLEQETLKARLNADKSEYMKMVKMQVVLRNILFALSHLHERNIIHGDIKPENIFIRDLDDVVIGDFGSSKMAWCGGSTAYPKNEDRSSIAYMAPEVLIGQRPYSESADMWSVGCIFAEMWSGSKVPIFANKYIETSSEEEEVGTPSDHWESDTNYEDIPSTMGHKHIMLYEEDSTPTGSQQWWSEEEEEEEEAEFGSPEEDGEEDFAEEDAPEEDNPRKDVLKKIFRTFHVPETYGLPGILPSVVNKYRSSKPPLGLRPLVLSLNKFPESKDLLLKLLCVNPGDRITAEGALLHPFFDWTEPGPVIDYWDD